jgi:hypothetical protein
VKKEWKSKIIWAKQTSFLAPCCPSVLGSSLESTGKMNLTPKIPGPLLPISTSKMLIISKKSPKKLKNAEISNPERLWFIRFTKKNLVKKYLKS